MAGLRFLDGGLASGPGGLEARGCSPCGFGQGISRVKLPSGRLIALCDFHQARIGRDDVLERAEQIAAAHPWQE